MKKLVTAIALCAAMSAMAQSVESENIVGYKTEVADGQYRMFSVKFVKVGGSATDLTDIVVGTSVEQYSDLLQVYDTSLGFVDYLWDGTTWVDSNTYEAINFNVVPGNGFLMQAATQWVTAGQVASTTTYVHDVPLSTFIPLGNAFPADQTLANFDWSSVATYSDLLQIYDVTLGFIDYLWDGTTWVDSSTYEVLPMTTPIEGFMFFSDTVSTLTQSLTPYSY